MSSFVWYNPNTWFVKDEPTVKMTAQPISVTTTPRSTVVMKRHAGRLSRLMWLKENGEVTTEMEAEIIKLSHLLAAEGNALPKTYKDARDLLVRLGG